MQHSIQGILFDKDDTLIDLAAFCRKPIYMTAAYLSQHMGKGTDEGWIERLAEASGFRGDTLLADAPIVSGTNRDLMEAWRTVLRTGGMQLSEELAQNALDYLQWACEHHGNLKARADLPALLQKLKARGIRLGVATSDDYLPTVQCLRALGVAHLFDAVFGADRVPNPKPAPDIARMFCSQYGLLPEQVVMVGDSANDMLFAKNSGITGVFFRPDGWEGPLPEGAQLCIQDLEQVASL